MPTVDVDPDELRRLTGHDDKSNDELRSDLFSLGLEFEGWTEADEFRIEFEPDRLDRLSVEGIARSLRYQYGDDRGVYRPDVTDAEWTIKVEDVPPQRPFVTGAIARGLTLDEAVLESIIQLQEKLHATIGRGRAKGAIGVHDLTMLKGEAVTDAADDPTDANPGSRPATNGAHPDDESNADRARNKIVRYTGIDAAGDTFVPLDSDREMTPGDVLADHPIGDDYAPLVSDYDRMPAIYDEIGLFSFPPVINGRRTEVTTDSRDLFVEMTGTDQWTIDKMLNVICYALDARGAQLEGVTIEYPDRELFEATQSDRVERAATLARPDLSTKVKTVAHDTIESMLGITFEAETVVDLIERSGLDATSGETDDGDRAYDVTIPPYRVDVLHPWDIVDDVGRAYGFNELEPRYPDVATVGGRHDRARLEAAVRETLVGLGFEDTLNFHLVGQATNYDRMNVEAGSSVVGGGDAAVIREPYSAEYELVRTWALPSLLLLLENNTHRSYPQDVAEVGFAAELDATAATGLAERTTVAAALARTDASYEDAKGKLATLARSFNVDLATPPTDHPTFIDGRAASVDMDGETVGVIGEIDPSVLVEHDLEVPVAAFEFRLAGLR